MKKQKHKLMKKVSKSDKLVKKESGKKVTKVTN